MIELQVVVGYKIESMYTILFKSLFVHVQFRNRHNALKKGAVDYDCELTEVKVCMSLCLYA